MGALSGLLGSRQHPPPPVALTARTKVKRASEGRLSDEKLHQSPSWARLFPCDTGKSCRPPGMCEVEGRALAEWNSISCLVEWIRKGCPRLLRMAHIAISNGKVPF
jgi:hypothetical protein